MPLEIRVTQADIDRAKRETQNTGDSFESVLAQMVANAVRSDPVAVAYLQEQTSARRAEEKEGGECLEDSSTTDITPILHSPEFHKSDTGTL